MSKLSLWSMVVVLLLIGGLYLFFVPADTTPTNDLTPYFAERLTTLGVEDIGQPIEGFDANLLIRAFPGLVASDFDGVASLEGIYEYTNGELAFRRTTSQPISSAERTLAPSGYDTLLTNVSQRLGVVAQTRSDVDEIISRVNTEEHIETRIDQGASALGVKVVPLEVLEDSRCPEDVTCIWAGTVRVRAQLESGLGTADQIFTLGEPITTEAEEITLVDVRPSTHSSSAIDLGDYRFVFEIRKR